jgi:3-isopropylmalate/(R)-2-methylmalate dehydratase large subunit
MVTGGRHHRVHRVRHQSGEIERYASAFFPLARIPTPAMPGHRGRRSISAPSGRSAFTDQRPARRRSRDESTPGLSAPARGRFEDFAEAARLLKGRKVKKGIMLKIVPATRRVYEELLAKGILQELFEAGAIVVNPGCGGCAEGHVGLTGKGEVQISTGNRNFAGKQGKGQTYLAGPAVVAASCVLGLIAGPEDL